MPFSLQFFAFTILLFFFSEQQNSDRENQEIIPIETVADACEATTSIKADDLWGDEDDSFLETIELDKNVLNKETKITSDYDYENDIWDNELEGSFNETLIDVEETIALSEDLCNIGSSNVQKVIKPSFENSGWQTIEKKGSCLNTNSEENKNEDCKYSKREDTVEEKILVGKSSNTVEFGNRTIDCEIDCSEGNREWQLDSNSQSNYIETQTLHKRKLPEWLTKSNVKKEVKRRMKMNSLFK